VLISPGDTEGFAQAIARLARDPELRLQLSRDARHRAEELTWEHSERALLGAYAALSARRA
jgi:glycosyltransferase involved in cell wall biosynthesis